MPVLNAGSCQGCSSQITAQELRGSQDGIAEVGIPEVGTAEVGTAEVGTAEVGIAEVANAEVGIAEVGSNATIRYPPLIPVLNSFP